MKFEICKLKPKSSLRLGEKEGFRKGTEVFIHSDTLFSAFCHSYLLLYGQQKLEQMLKQFVENNLPFAISSAFPYWNDKYYFPIPENQISKDKKTKKKFFIEKDGFEKLILGNQIDSIKDKIEFIPNKEEKKPYSMANNPHVSLSRLSNHPGEDYFHTGEVYYINTERESSGLYFLYKINDNTFEKQLKATIRLIADEGIGGDRSLGKGFFEQPPVFENIEIEIPNDISSIITLSLYLPIENELSDISESYYNIIARRGYIYSPYCQSLRRKSVRMFTEGSVFSNSKSGKMANVTPDIFKEHRIYRYGYAFTLPCILKAPNEN